MSNVREFFKTTVIGGLLVVLPAGVLLALIVRAVKAIHGFTAPMMSHLPIHVIFPGIAAVAILLLFCFLTGLVIKTRIGKRLGQVVERGVLEKLPGYALLKNFSRATIGNRDETVFAPALFRTDEGMMPAFIIEENADDSITIFVPSSSTPAAGQIYIVPRDRVRKLDVPIAKAINCITKWGVGGGELMKGMQS